MEALVIKRKHVVRKDNKGRTFKNERYFIDPVNDEPLSRQQLTKLLFHVMGLHIEEIAFMYEDFRQHADRKKAYFGMNGLYLYSR